MGGLLVTWDAVNKGSGVVLSNNNLNAMIPNMSNTVRASLGRDVGKWYWEIETVSTTTTAMIGIVNGNANLNTGNYSTQNARYYYAPNGYKYPEATNYGARYQAIGTIIGIALDLDIGTLEFFLNGVSQGKSHTNIKTMGKVFPAITDGSSGSGNSVYNANFGDRPFKYQAPDGFKDYGDYAIKRIMLSKGGKFYSFSDTTNMYQLNMTSNTSPVPYVASASSIWSTSFEPWKAFNGTNKDGSDSWVTATGVHSGWIQIDLGKPYAINNIAISARADSTAPTTAPKDFTILGSIDGVSYVELFRKTGETKWTNAETKEYNFNNNIKYRYLKVDVQSDNGGSYIGIGEIRIGYIGNSLNQISKIDGATIEKFGNNTEIDVSRVIKSKNYILQDSVSENEQGLWEAKLDRKPLSISFE